MRNFLLYLRGPFFSLFFMAASPSPAVSRLHPEIARLQSGIVTRFLEEVGKLHAQGYTQSMQALSRELGIGRNVIAEMRQGKRYVKPAYIRRLADVYRADYHYILFGVEEPDPERRGKYRKASTPTASPTIVAELDAWINYRFVKEVERLAREGRVLNRQWLVQLLYATPTAISKVRLGKAQVQAHWLVLLKQHLNADFHFILWGVDRPDISGPVKVVQGDRIRLDVFPKVTLAYAVAANWGPYIPPRDPDDDMRLLQRFYYMDLPTLADADRPA
jgi:transcriptional regulator with XRE-family HTH domain